MSEPIYVDGRRAYDWYMNFDLNTIAEIPIERARAVLPRGIHPQEPRPGVALLGLAVTSFDPGNVGHLPAFNEISLYILVKPHLTEALLPRFALYVLKVGSACDAFLRWARHRDKMPIYRGESVEVTIDLEALSGSARDAHGPIFKMRNYHPTPVFTEEVLELQVVTEADGHRYVQRVKWAGPQCLHQHPGGRMQIYDHPFFAGLGLGTQILPCYEQMITPPRTAVVMRFVEPVRIS